MESIDVSIIIVNFNTKELLRNCLNSILSNTKNISYEIIISDNGSSDGSIDMVKMDFPSVILIENNQNLGFGKANNIGLSNAKGKYIFYLNSDTIFENNAIKIFYDYFELHDEIKIGALGCNLRDNYGYITHSYGNFPTIKKSISYVLNLLLKNIIKSILYVLHINNKSKEIPCLPYFGEVDYITGADLFIKNNEYAKYNENFFLYYEETYLEWMMKEAGYKRIIIDGPLIKHFTRGGVKKNFRETFLSRSFIESFYSMITYFNLQKKKRGLGVLCFLITLIYLNPIFIPKNIEIIKTIWRKRYATF